MGNVIIESQGLNTNYSKSKNSAVIFRDSQGRSVAEILKKSSSKSNVEGFIKPGAKFSAVT